MPASVWAVVKRELLRFSCGLAVLIDSEKHWTSKLITLQVATCACVMSRHVLLIIVLDNQATPVEVTLRHVTFYRCRLVVKSDDATHGETSCWHMLPPGECCPDDKPKTDLICTACKSACHAQDTV